MHTSLSFLSKSDIILIGELVHGLSTLESIDSYKDMIYSLKNFIPFDYATSGLVDLDVGGKVVGYNLVNINFTDAWIKAYDEQKIYNYDVTVEENFKYYKTQCWSETYKKYNYPKKLLSFANDFNLLNGYSCGAKSLGVYRKPSMISFVWNFQKRSRHVSSIIDYLTPYLHIGLSNVLYCQRVGMKKNILTEREKEVLSWVKNGKSSWEISSIMKISEATVNYHMYKSIAKLDAVNRTQAVAVALQYGFIDFD